MKPISVKNEALSARNKALKQIGSLKYSQWQAEHERLGIDPLIRNNVREDFRMQPNKNRRPKVNVPQFVQQPQPSVTNLPPQRMVSVGAQSERLWLPEESEQSQQPVMQPSAEPEPEPESEHIYFDQVESPDEVNISIYDVEEGDTFLVIGGLIRCASPKPSDIEDVVNKLVVESDNPIAIEDLMVLKKMSLKFGVSLG